MSRVIRLDSQVLGTDDFNNIAFDYGLVDIIEVVNPIEWKGYEEFIHAVKERSVEFAQQPQRWIVRSVSRETMCALPKDQERNIGVGNRILKAK